MVLIQSNRWCDAAFLCIAILESRILGIRQIERFTKRILFRKNSNLLENTFQKLNSLHYS